MGRCSCNTNVFLHEKLYYQFWDKTRKLVRKKSPLYLTNFHWVEMYFQVKIVHQSSFTVHCFWPICISFYKGIILQRLNPIYISICWIKGGISISKNKSLISHSLGKVKKSPTRPIPSTEATKYCKIHMGWWLDFTIMLSTH